MIRIIGGLESFIWVLLEIYNRPRSIVLDYRSLLRFTSSFEVAPLTWMDQRAQTDDVAQFNGIATGTVLSLWKQATVYKFFTIQNWTVKMLSKN